MLTEYGSLAENAAYKPLEEALRALGARLHQELDDPLLAAPAKRTLANLGRRWDSLMVPVDQQAHGLLGMTNNVSERNVRPFVVGRKAYRGSRSIESANLTADAFTLIATAARVGWNPKVWLTEYLTACANAGGRAPDDSTRFLPWGASEADRARWSNRARPRPLDSS